MEVEIAILFLCCPVMWPPLLLLYILLCQPFLSLPIKWHIYCHRVSKTERNKTDINLSLKYSVFLLDFFPAILWLKRTVKQFKNLVPALLNCFKGSGVVFTRNFRAVHFTWSIAVQKTLKIHRCCSQRSKN